MHTTPVNGPWVAEPGVGRGAWIAKARGEWVALACGDTDVSAREHAEMICAFPELLAAAKALIDRWPTDQLPDGPFYDEARSLRAAIAKAEGRSV